jgi:DNA-binding MarR family transcriptional regulator
MLHELALGSRLKSLSDRFYAAADAAYKRHDAGIEARWFPLLCYLRDVGPAGVTEAAEAIGQTHSAVSQLSDRLLKAGLVTRCRHAEDARRTELALSEEGARRIGRLGPLWCAIRRAAAAATQRGEGGLMAALEACETSLDEQPLEAVIETEYARLSQATLEIVPYQPKWRDDFYRLNAQWLRRYFVIEDLDERVLRNPRQYVLDPGGVIFMAVLDGEPIGTCALLKEEEGLYELSKMAVEEGYRGLGAGRKLLDAAIAKFHALGGGTLFLESSSRLHTALGMYERAGFRMQPTIRPGSHYARADVYMVYAPEGGAKSA